MNPTLKIKDRAKPAQTKSEKGEISRKAHTAKPLLRPWLYVLLVSVLMIFLVIIAFYIGQQQQQKAHLLSSATGPSEAEQAASGVPLAAYDRQDLIIVGVNDQFEQLNPLYASGDGEVDAVSLIFEPLFQIDANKELIACLAQSFSFDEETKRLTVVLRTDHTFRDGRVVNAEDVVYTYSCLLSSAYDGPLKGRFADLLAVEAGEDENTVIFQFDELTTEPDLRLLTIGILKSDYYPYQPQRIFELRDGNLYPEGSGAFFLIENSGNHVVLQLRPGYAGQIKTIEIRQVASDSKYRLLQEGRLDIVRNVWDTRMQQRALSLPGYFFYPYETSVDSYLLINPLPQPHHIIQNASQRLAILLTVAGKPQNDEQLASLETLKSKELILYFFQGVDHQVFIENQKQAQTIASSLTSAGLNVSLQSADWPELAKLATNYDYDLILLPATANNRLPEHTVIMDESNQTDASALIVAYRPEVLIVCKRLSQFTCNPYAHPFAASVGSWTDRIENIRILEPDEEIQIEEDLS